MSTPALLHLMNRDDGGVVLGLLEPRLGTARPRAHAPAAGAPLGEVVAVD